MESLSDSSRALSNKMLVTQTSSDAASNLCPITWFSQAFGTNTDLRADYGSIQHGDLQQELNAAILTVILQTEEVCVGVCVCVCVSVIESYSSSLVTPDDLVRYFLFRTLTRQD